MENKSICEVLQNNPYPGRGIFIGRSQDNKKNIAAYFIMGRSENSRNRIFAITSDGIKTEAHEPAKMTDPSLVIYHPVRWVEHGGTMHHIVTNGDQTDTIRDYILEGKTFLDALHTRAYEPDEPNFTPRISGMAVTGGSYMLSILKKMDDMPDSCSRQFFCYEAPKPGTGHFIHTYVGDGNPLPPFLGEPTWLALPEGSIESIANDIWLSLDNDNKVSLYVCEISIDTGKHETIIIKNKNSGD